MSCCKQPSDPSVTCCEPEDAVDADAVRDRVRAGYRDRAAAEPGRFRVIDAGESAERVAASALDALQAHRHAIQAAR